MIEIKRIKSQRRARHTRVTAMFLNPYQLDRSLRSHRPIRYVQPFTLLMSRLSYRKKEEDGGFNGEGVESIPLWQGRRSRSDGDTDGPGPNEELGQGPFEM